MSEQQELFCYKQMPVWTADEIPEALLSKHNTAAGTWGLSARFWIWAAVRAAMRCIWV